MTVTIAKWTVEEYHKLVAIGVLRDGSISLTEFPDVGISVSSLFKR